MPDPQSLSALEIEALGPEHVEELERFLSALHQAGDDAHFHPHPADRQYVEALARDTGQDLHYVVTSADGAVVAYGMLRGWADHAVPSLGIAVHRAMRGTGVGRMLMAFLHDEARRNGASEVRLRVYPDNVAARRLYTQLGYEFAGDEEDGQLVGRIRL